MPTTKQRITRYRPNTLPHPLALTLGTALLALSSTASAQAPDMGRQASGSWQMPSTTTAPASSPPATPQAYTAPPAPPPTYAYPPPPPASYGYAVTAEPEAGDRVDPEDEESNPEDPPNFDLAASTQVPLSIGALATVELPGRLLLQLEAGWMPPAYGAAINGIVRSIAGYDQAIGALIDESFDSGAVVRLAGGWRPFPSAGFEIFGGYTFVKLSGSISPSSVAQVVGGDFAAEVASQVLTDDVNISSSLHNFHVGLGWRWVAWDHLVIRTSIAYMQTLSSSSSVDTPQLPEAGEAATPFLDAELSEVFGTYVKMPVFGASVGYRF